MAWSTGSTTSYLDLVDIVKTTAAANGWTVLRDVTATEKELIMKGSGSGSDEIYVGVRTYRDTNTLAFNWELAGFTGYESGNTWSTQPGISPGRADSLTPLTSGGAFVPLDNNPMTFWLSVNSRRILLVVKVGSAYVNAYLGFYNTFKTSAEHPYPLLIAGTTCQKETRFNSNRESMSFLPYPISRNSNSSGLTLVPGPMLLRWVDGSWISFLSRYENVSAQTASARHAGTLANPCGVVYPMNQPDMNSTASIAQEDAFAGTSPTILDVVPDSQGATPTYEIHPTPNGGGGTLVPIFPVGLQMEYPSKQIFGELDGVFWCNIGGSGLGSEDIITAGGSDHRVFQNVFRTTNNQYMAIKES